MEAAARVCLPEPSLQQPWGSLQPQARRPRGRGLAPPGSLGQPPWSRAGRPGTRPCGPHSPSPTTPSLPPSLFSSPSPSRAVRGERLRGAGSGYPPGALAAGPWPQPRDEAESPRSTEPTPRTPAGMQSNSAPAPRPAAVQPPPSEAEPLVQTPRGRSSFVTLGPRGLRCPGRGEGSSGGGVH